MVLQILQITSNSKCGCYGVSTISVLNQENLQNKPSKIKKKKYDLRELILK
jgi:hypothetical protein